MSIHYNWYCPNCVKTFIITEGVLENNNCIYCDTPLENKGENKWSI